MFLVVAIKIVYIWMGEWVNGYMDGWREGRGMHTQTQNVKLFMRFGRPFTRQLRFEVPEIANF